MDSMKTHHQNRKKETTLIHSIYILKYQYMELG